MIFILDHGKVSTSVEEQPSPGMPPDAISADAEVPADSTDEPRSLSRAVSATRGIDVPHKVLTQANGTVIIEKLDTPAIRRERFIRRKAEKQRLAEANLSVESTHQESMLMTEPGPSTPLTKAVTVTTKDEMQNYDNFEDESDLSELSEDESQGLGSEGHADAEEDLPSKRESTNEQPRKSSRKKVTKIDQYSEATIGSSCSIIDSLYTYHVVCLVWAKSGLLDSPLSMDFLINSLIESFPWWPAVVFSETSPEVPKKVLEAYKLKKQKRKIKLYIVQFYDKLDSW